MGGGKNKVRLEVEYLSLGQKRKMNPACRRETGAFKVEVFPNIVWGKLNYHLRKWC